MTRVLLPAGFSCDPARSGMHWGLKRSLLSYVARAPDGRCSATDGARASDSGGFHYALDAVDVDASGAIARLAFSGDVRLSAHGGMMFVSIKDPALVLGEDGETLLLHDALGAAGGGSIEFASCSVTKVETPAGAVIGISVGQVHLTQQGPQLFGGYYSPGEPFEDFQITLVDRTSSEGTMT